jgi:predicted nucleic acid-binding protein
VPVDSQVARYWGELWQRLGFNSPDIVIAATALAHGLTVVTRNVRHFERTGVEILNPYTATP